MTEKDIYSNGVALLEEWEDVNYCEHSFKFKDEWLTDKEVVDLLNDLNDENELLKIRFNEEREKSLKFCRNIDTLTIENEQLKSRVGYLERKIDRERTSYQKQHEKWEEEIQKENEQLKHECNYLQNRLDDFICLQNENKQLKQKIKSINEILNEDIGYIESLRKIEEALK